MERRSRILVVLDLDHTLMFGTLEPLARPPDFRLFEYSVYMRPHVTELLEFVFSRFTVGVWTTAGREYAAGAVQALFAEARKPLFVWDAERCTTSYDSELREHVVIKKLQKLKTFGYDRSRILVIDDSPETARLNYGNLIPVSPYEGAETDDELLCLTEFLTRFPHVEDVRKVAKRSWRGRRPKSD